MAAGPQLPPIRRRTLATRPRLRKIRPSVVLAAFAPVPRLKWGIVTKIDLSELLWPFVKATAIIALTVLFRLALMPLTIKQTKSMYEMQRIQPKIKELQKKYKDDKQKLQEETLKFYQDNKVNPFGGCLPMILQMPVFIALFQVLGGTEKKLEAAPRRRSAGV